MATAATSQSLPTFISIDSFNIEVPIIRGVHYDAATLLYQGGKETLGYRAPPRAPPIRQRDSLRRREALLIGKEGSRRRRRWDNAHLLTNPHAVEPLEVDYLQPAYEPREPLYPLLASLSITRDDSSDEESEENPKGQGYIYHGFSRSRLRARCRKSHITEAMIKVFETPIIDFIKEGGGSDGLLSFDLAHDSFQRFVLHAIARFHGLISYSRHSRDSPKRLSYIIHPRLYNQDITISGVSFWEWIK